MTLTRWLDLQKRLGDKGTVARLAAELRVAPLTVYRWMQGKAAIPCYRAVQICSVTEGQVRPEDWPAPADEPADVDVVDPRQLSLIPADAA